jgi:hypothetical protein
MSRVASDSVLKDILMSTSAGTTSSASVYTTPAFWERLWRTAGLQSVLCFIVAYIVYGQQPPIGASAPAMLLSSLSQWKIHKFLGPCTRPSLEHPHTDVYLKSTYSQYVTTPTWDSLNPHLSPSNCVDNSMDKLVDIHVDMSKWSLYEIQLRSNRFSPRLRCVDCRRYRI